MPASAPAGALGGGRWRAVQPAGGDDTPLWLQLFDMASTEPAGGSLAGAWTGRQILPGDSRAPEQAGGLLLNLMDVPPEHEDEFNDWYNTEHVARFAAVEGVIVARRFRSETDSPRYAAFYHLASTDVLKGDAWREAATTPWTARMRSIRYNNRRLLFTPG